MFFYTKSFKLFKTKGSNPVPIYPCLHGIYQRPGSAFFQKNLLNDLGMVFILWRRHFEIFFFAYTCTVPYRQTSYMHSGTYSL
jgi:hypothetical protein